MALGIKYFDDDIKHFQGMIETESAMLDSLIDRQKNLPAGSTLWEPLQEAIENSQDTIEMYRDKIRNLIEKGDENG